MLADGGSMRTYPGRGKNESRVHIDDGITRGAHALQSLAQENRRVSAFPFRIGGRKQRTNIRRSHGAEQSIGERMQKHVTVRMPTQTFGWARVTPPILSGIPVVNS